MRAVGKSDEAAKSELNELIIRWENTIRFLNETRVDPNQFQIYTREFSDEKKAFILNYMGNISGESLSEYRKTLSILGHDLRLALSKAIQNYKDEQHKQRMELIRAVVPILVIVVTVILIVVVKLLFNIEIPFLK